MKENLPVKFPKGGEVRMKAVGCPSCGAKMKRNGRTCVLSISFEQKSH